MASKFWKLEDIFNKLVNTADTALGVTLTADSTNKLEVAGDEADDAAATGNPVRIAGRAKNFDGSAPGKVSAEGDVTELVTDLERRLLVNPSHPNLFRAKSGVAAQQADVELKAAPGAATNVYVKSVWYSANANTSWVLSSRSGTAASVSVTGTLYLLANTGKDIVFDPPLRLATNLALVYSTSTPVTNFTVGVSGWLGP